MITRTEPSKLVQGRQTIPALAEKRQAQARVLVSLARSDYFDYRGIHFIQLNGPFIMEQVF